jgi:hypothetical protein
MPICEYACQACGQHFDRLFLSLSRVPAEMACPARRSGARGSSSSEAPTEPPAGQPPVVGRKEIQAAQEKKRQLREQAKYGA